MTPMKSDDEKCRYLSYKASFSAAVTIFVMSLFAQWVNWFIYEKAGYSWGYTLITPLVLCMMYHFVQLDAGKHGSFSRVFFFVFAVALPLIFGIGLTLIMKKSSPDIYLFDPKADYDGSARSLTAVYAGRFIFTSAYLMIFALIDIPFLKRIDQKEKKK